VSGLPRELRDLVASGPMAHLSTINANGSPQVTVIWIGLDGDDLVSGHMSRRDLARDAQDQLRAAVPASRSCPSGVQ